VGEESSVDGTAGLDVRESSGAEANGEEPSGSGRGGGGGG